MSDTIEEMTDKVQLLKITKSPAVSKIADRTGCQWP